MTEFTMRCLHQALSLVIFLVVQTWTDVEAQPKPPSKEEIAAKALAAIVDSFLDSSGNKIIEEYKWQVIFIADNSDRSEPAGIPGTLEIPDGSDTKFYPRVAFGAKCDYAKQLRVSQFEDANRLLISKERSGGDGGVELPEDMEGDELELGFYFRVERGAAIPGLWNVDKKKWTVKGDRIEAGEEYLTVRLTGTPPNSQRQACILELEKDSQVSLKWIVARRVK